MILGDGSCKCIDLAVWALVSGQHSFPFQAAIIINEDATPDSFCEGALISPNYVLTSGICLYGWPESLDMSHSHLRIVLGKNEYQNTGEVEKRFTIESRVQFPTFDVSKPVANNFALFKLSQPVKISPTANYVCLPTTDAKEVSALKMLQF